MERFATEAWGPLGAQTVQKWAEFNERFFDGKLRPIPVVISRTLPFGKSIGACAYNPGTHGRTITLNVPKDHNRLVADNGALLHEMVHQYLFERGEDASHAGEGWRREIMRLNKALTGTEIWAGRSKTAWVDGKVTRINEPNADGSPSVSQGRIARWPHDFGLDLGRLGT